MRQLVMFAVLVVFVSIASKTRALDVTACGAVIPPRETGVLQSDLTCGAPHPLAIEVQAGATLDLNGHTLTFTGPGGGGVVWCSGRSCTIRSSAATRGHIVGTYEGSCVWGTEVPRRAKLENVTISHCQGGVFFRKARVSATDVDVTDCSYFAMFGLKLDLLNVTSVDTGEYGPSGGRRVRGTNVVMINCGEGIFGDGSVRIDGLVAQGNAEFAVHARSARLENSTLSGNGVDLSTIVKPQLETTSCERSERRDPPLGVLGSWGVCSLD